MLRLSDDIPIPPFMDLIEEAVGAPIRMENRWRGGRAGIPLSECERIGIKVRDNLRSLSAVFGGTENPKRVTQFRRAQRAPP